MAKIQISEVIVRIQSSVVADIGNKEIIDLLIDQALGKKGKDIMQTEEILHEITKPFILAGIYKDEKSALIDITLDYVSRKIAQYDNIIVSFKKKYSCDFDQFSAQIKNNASLAIEDDWMEWKSATEMRQSWKNANKMIISNE